MTKHTGIRAYAFQCSYNSDSWLDNPTSLISALQSALSGITDLDSYARLLSTMYEMLHVRKLK